MRLFRLLVLLGMVSGGAGCGLPDSYFLRPPEVNIQASLLNPEFHISGRSAGSDTGATFQGYELYYKFYGNNTDTTFTSDSTSYGTGSTYTDLQQGGFQRLCLGPGSISGLVADTSAGFASAPLVPSDTVSIILNDPNPPPAVPLDVPISYYSTPAGYQEVRRFVTLPSGSGCKTFRSNADSLIDNFDPALNDADLSGSAGLTIWNQVTTINSGYIYVMMYALSYGNSKFDGTPIYSSPVYLGYTKILVYRS